MNLDDLRAALNAAANDAEALGAVRTYLMARGLDIAPAPRSGRAAGRPRRDLAHDFLMAVHTETVMRCDPNASFSRAVWVAGELMHPHHGLPQGDHEAVMARVRRMLEQYRAQIDAHLSGSLFLGPAKSTRAKRGRPRSNNI